MKRACTALFFFVSLHMASAEQLFIRNQPFKEATTNSEGRLQAPLEAVARAFKFELTRNGEVLLLGPQPTGTEFVEPGVYFGGKKLSSAHGPDVDLQAFVQEIGGRWVANKALGTVDLYAPSAKNCAALVGPRLITWGNGAAPSQLGTVVQTLKGTVPLESIYLDVDHTEHPDYKSYERYFKLGATPYSVLLDPAGRVISDWQQLPSAAQLQQAYSGFAQARSMRNHQAVQVRASSFGGSSRSSG